MHYRIRTLGNMGASLNNSTVLREFPCVPASSRNMILVCFPALPVHAFLLWILIRKIPDVLPRHMLIKMLCISDLLFFLSGIVLLFGQILALSPLSLECRVMKTFVLLQGLISFLVSSGTIIGLSIERYVACVHCLRLHTIVTARRVNIGLAVLCFIAFSQGLICVLFLPATNSSNITPRSPPSLLSYTVVLPVYITTLVLIVTQTRLYIICRQKMRISPHGPFTGRAESNRFFNNEVKLAVSTGALAGYYIVCLLPLSTSYLHSIVYGERFSVKIHWLFALLACTKILFEPFLYGFGMADIRGKLVVQLLRLKARLTSSF